MPHSTGLNGTQFSILNVLEPLIPKDQTKYKKKHWDKVGATFYGRHKVLNTRCCEYNNSGEKANPREQPNQNKEWRTIVREKVTTAKRFRIRINIHVFLFIILEIKLNLIELRNWFYSVRWRRFPSMWYRQRVIIS